MSLPAVPRILGPNLGCPEILAPGDLHGAGFELLVATRKKDGLPGPGWSLHALPSFKGDGAPFDLSFDASAGTRPYPWEIDDDSMPAEIAAVSDTRRLVSTTLRWQTFGGKARFWLFHARTPSTLAADHFRQVCGKPRSTLYDLELRQDGKTWHRAMHALCLRQPSQAVRFAHITDLHVSERNDLWAGEQASILPPPPSKFINFNEHLRRFIRWANERADRGELDLVLALGDLVDFVEQGITKPQAAPNNWQVLIAIFTGANDESERGNPGLRVPIFTTLGNHDWRRNPYPPEVEAEIIGLDPKRAERLDYVYRDSSEAVGERIARVHERLVKEGSPILARSWWSSMVGFGLRGISVGMDRIFLRFVALSNTALRYAFYALAAALGALGLGVGSLFPPEWQVPQWLRDAWARHHVVVLLVSVMLPGLAWCLLATLRSWLGTKLRRSVQGLLAIEKSTSSLRDYFALINPYFNYALKLEKCYFLILDTGYDCLTAQSFWDDGGKKIQRLSLGDNIIGRSPDTMGFYPPNIHYPFSQITWTERVLACMQKETKQELGKPRVCRVFVGLHAPVANLSPKARAEADKKLATAKTDAIRLPAKRRWPFNRFDVCYGTTNHYLSQFYYLCLGAREESPGDAFACGVDVVLAGHAHWCQEFKLVRPEGSPATWKPAVHYGHLAEAVERASATNTAEPEPTPPLGPLLLQTAACGPPCFPKHGKSFPAPPYYRLVSVEADMRVSTLAQKSLG